MSLASSAHTTSGAAMPPAEDGGQADFEHSLAEKIARLRHEVSILHADALAELQTENEALKSRLSSLESGVETPSGARKGADEAIDLEHVLAPVADEANSEGTESPAVAAAKVVADEQKAAKRKRKKEAVRRRAEEEAAAQRAEEASAAKDLVQKAAKEAEDALKEAELKARSRKEDDEAKRQRVREAIAAKRAADEAAAKPSSQPEGGIDSLISLAVDNALAPSSDEVEIVVRHAMEDVEAHVRVAAAATFLDVKRAIARHTGTDEVLKKGRLARRRNGKFAAFKDDEAVGNTTEVLLIGAALVAGSAEARAS